MIILGLHFGHDAAATVVRDGRTMSYVLRERFTRVKHAVSLDLATIKAALREAGIGWPEIDAVAICSTQGVELIVDQPDRLKIRFGGPDPFGKPCSVLDGRSESATLADREVGTLLDFVYDEMLSQTWLGRSYAQLFPEHAGRTRADFSPVPWVDTFTERPAWTTGKGLTALAASEAEISEELRFGFHLPVRVELDGHELPGYAVHHHLAHAASGYYASGYRRSAILTHDGYSDGQSYHSGMFYLGEEEALYPLAPHHLHLGGLYDRVGVALGLGVVGAAGKLMGLAAYGRPRFFDSRFVGNFTDLSDRFSADPVSAWLYHCRSEATRLGYDLTPYGQAASATAPINADIAASTQLLFEEIRIEAVRSLDRMLGNGGRTVSDLCLSGGTALNCPSNSHIAAAGPFERVFVEPACDDSGIATGAALAVYHSLLGHPLVPDAPAFGSPYLGAVYSEAEVSAALLAMDGELRIRSCADPAAEAAADLAADLVIGWFEAGSEAGPRALGHRSILADPRPAGNWARVNRLKGREDWRPFAPAVLAERAAEWFDEVPLPSPYMLFNARVRRIDIPAVTHVDGTARIQTVDAGDGGYRRVIEAFHRLTGVPVVLNTSFNGPGEPIVERPGEAVAFFAKSELDVLYICGFRVTRRSA